MVFFTNIQDLQYYQNTGNIPCYCEELVYASDMIFQIPLNTSSTSGFFRTFYVYSVDGLTQLENATAYFESYIFEYGGKKYINARLKQFSPTMCSTACYIIRVVITANNVTVFDGYSERYCQNQCCDVPRGITIVSENDFRLPGFDNPPGDLPEPTDTSTPTGAVIPTSGCAQPLLRLVTWADCLDAHGVFYGIPTNVYVGSASFAFRKLTNFAGRIKQRPRDIKREISYNCRLQRSESATPYMLEGFEWFPTWKMDEIEKMLHANHIQISDYKNEYSYQWDGGQAFELLSNSQCIDVFKLNATLRSCFSRAIYSCTPACNVATTGYIAIPAGFQSRYFSETGVSIADDFESLMVWFNGQQDVQAEEIDASGYACADSIYKLVALTGDGTLPSSIYYGQRNQSNRAFLVRLEDPEDICSLFPSTGCGAPVIGTISVSDVTPDTPEIGTVVVTPIVPTDLTIETPADWAINSQDAGLYGGITVVFDLEVTTTLYNGAGQQLANVLIAYMQYEGRPDSVRNIAIGDVLVSILPNGEIRYTGQVTSGDGTSITLTLTGITYNLQ